MFSLFASSLSYLLKCNKCSQNIQWRGLLRVSEGVPLKLAVMVLADEEDVQCHFNEVRVDSDHHQQHH